MSSKQLQNSFKIIRKEHFFEISLLEEQILSITCTHKGQIKKGIYTFDALPEILKIFESTKQLYEHFHQIKDNLNDFHSVPEGIQIAFSISTKIKKRVKLALETVKFTKEERLENQLSVLKAQLNKVMQENVSLKKQILEMSKFDAKLFLDQQLPKQRKKVEPSPLKYSIPSSQNNSIGEKYRYQRDDHKLKEQFLKDLKRQKQQKQVQQRIKSIKFERNKKLIDYQVEAEINTKYCLNLQIFKKVLKQFLNDKFAPNKLKWQNQLDSIKIVDKYPSESKAYKFKCSILEQIRNQMKNYMLSFEEIKSVRMTCSQ